MPVDILRAAFELAKKGKKEAIVAFLTEKGYAGRTDALRRRSGKRMTVLHAACDAGNLTAVEVFLDNKSDPEEKDIDMNTPIFYAVRKGRKAVVSYLVEERGVNVNAKNIFTIAPLHTAAWMDKLELVQYLVESGAEVNIETSFGNNALHFAARDGYLRIITYLKEKGGMLHAKQTAFLRDYHTQPI